MWVGLVRDPEDHGRLLEKGEVASVVFQLALAKGKAWRGHATNISHLGKKEIIFKMLVRRRVVTLVVCKPSLNLSEGNARFFLP